MHVTSLISVVIAVLGAVAIFAWMPGGRRPRAALAGSALARSASGGSGRAAGPSGAPIPVPVRVSDREFGSGEAER
jgi:hypothetical protein